MVSRMKAKLHPVRVCIFSLFILSQVLLPFTSEAQENQGVIKGWASSSEPLKEMEQVRKLIKAPVFKDKDFLVTAYGAKGDGVTKNTESFKRQLKIAIRRGVEE